MFFGKQPNLEIIIGNESAIRGDVTSKGTVRIDGSVEGGVAADCLIIGEKGIVTGNVTVRQMIIGGRIVGDIRAVEGVDIQRTGNVCGDIFSARLSIADGAGFDGRSTMQRTKEIPYRGNEDAAHEGA